MTNLIARVCREVRAIYKRCKWYESGYYFFALLCLIVATVCFRANYFSLVVASLSITASILNIKSIKYCFYFYAASVFCYAFIALQNQFYGEFMLNLFFLFPVYVRGVLRWRAGNVRRHEQVIVEIYNLERRWIGPLILIGLLVTFGYGYILQQLGSAMPYFNSFATFACATAAVLATKRIKQQWYFWLSYTISLIIIWASAVLVSYEQIPMLAVNILFVGFNSLGFYNWHKLQKYLNELHDGEI